MLDSRSLFWLSILNIAVCTCQCQTPKLSLPLTLPTRGLFPSSCYFLFFFQVAFSVKQSRLQCPEMTVMISKKEVAVCPRHIVCSYCESGLPGTRNWHCPPGKGKASLWLHARFSGLRETTREQATTSATRLNICQGQEKKERGNPAERCTAFCRETKDASPSSHEWPRGRLFSTT